MTGIFYNGEIHSRYNTPYVWHALKPLVLNKLEIVENYYKHVGKRVKNNNILVRIIKDMHTNADLDFFSYLSHIEMKKISAIRTHAITSLVSTGRTTTNFLEHTECLFRSRFKTDEDYTLYYASKEVTTRAIKVLTWNDADLSMMHPYDVYSENILVLEVDVIVLLLKYNAWRKERMLNDEDINPALFVYTIIMTEMIRDMFNHAILNRFFSLENSERVRQLEQRHPVSTNVLTSRIDVVLIDVLRLSRKIKTSATERIALLPVIGISPIELLQYKKETNYQSEWFNLIARMEYMYKLLRHQEERATRSDKQLLTGLRRYFIYIDKNHILTKANVSEFREDIEELMNKLKKIIKDRL